MKNIHLTNLFARRTSAASVSESGFTWAQDAPFCVAFLVVVALAWMA